MKFAVLFSSAALLCAVPAQAMDAETFYVKALALKKKGRGAVFSKEIKPMARLFQAAAASVKAENEQARAAGKPLFCAPQKYRLTAEQFLEGFASIPQECRRIQTVRDA